MSAWIALRRSLLQVIVLGCAASLMTSGRLTWRLALPAAVYATFVPVCEIASLAVVARRSGKRVVSLIDPFLASHTAWLLLILIFSAIWAFVPTAIVWGWRPLDVKSAEGAAAALIFAWSAYVDFGFFRRVLERTPVRAAFDLAIQRLLCWGAALAIFVAPAGWQTAASWLGL